MRNLKIVEKAKIWLILLLVLFVAGAAVWGAIGLNKGIEYKGGVEVRINAYTTLSKDDLDKAARKVFSDEKLNIVEFREVSEGKTLVYKFSIKDVPTELKGKLETALSAYKDQLVAADKKPIEVDTFGASANSLPALWALLALGVATIVSFIYLVFRYKWRRALSVIFSMAASVYLTICITAICRIPVNTSYIGAIAFTYVFSAILSVFYAYKVRDYIRSAAYKNATREDIANAAASECLVKNIIITASVVVLLIAGIIFAANGVRFTLLAALAGALVSLFVTTVAQSSFYAYIGKGGIMIKNDYVPKQKAIKSEPEKN